MQNGSYYSNIRTLWMLTLLSYKLFSVFLVPIYVLSTNYFKEVTYMRYYI